MLAFGQITVSIRPTSLRCATRSAVTDALVAMDGLGIGGTLQSVSVDCELSKDIVIRLVAAENWGNDLKHCATRLLEALSSIDSCKDVRVRFSDLPMGDQIASDAYYSRIRR